MKGEGEGEGLGINNSIFMISGRQVDGLAKIVMVFFWRLGGVDCVPQGRGGR